MTFDPIILTPDPENDTIDFSRPDLVRADGQTQLCYLCQYDKPDIVRIQMLVEAGANVNLASSNGLTPLMIARNQFFLEAVNYLILNGAL